MKPAAAKRRDDLNQNSFRLRKPRGYLKLTSKVKQTIIYTLTDEAPMLATHALLPIIQAFGRAAGIEIETSDISLAARILAAFPECLSEEQRVPDALASLARLVSKPEANIIKLPNISASAPQIRQAIKELQEKNYNVPPYIENPRDEEEKSIRARYDRIKGSAVNPVLREGNSDRRPPAAVKRYAKEHPHPMGSWFPTSKTHVSSMSHGDFYDSEKSITTAHETEFHIDFVPERGKSIRLRPPAVIEGGEIVDSAIMSRQALREYFELEMTDAKSRGLLLSLHLKATMMKVSDPVIFGHAVSVYFKSLFEKHQALFEELGVRPEDGLGQLEGKIAQLEAGQREQILADLEAAYNNRPHLAMVNSEKGITNLHVPSDVIIDASMPALIRASGKMYGRDGSLSDTKALIPDRSYAPVFQCVIDFCRKNGAFNPATMGSVSNIGLMAQRAEEYGSHDKTFIAPAAGLIRAVDANGKAFLEQRVEEGDIFRMCQTKDAAVRNWVELAVSRARRTKIPTIFWLDRDRPHDAQLIAKVTSYMQGDEGHDIKIAGPAEACRITLERAAAGRDTISATGNVLRDYLTDLFPILELGTSAKMLSIVPLMNGGGLFETGAGGSAPKHVQQLQAENHLRWDSCGEYLALAASLQHLAETADKPKAGILTKTLDTAIGRLLENQKTPSRKCGELDNRGSTYYLAAYWSQALAEQNEDTELKAKFLNPARVLVENERKIIGELAQIQGKPARLGGYYIPNPSALEAIMQPSPTLNRIIDSI